MAIKRVYTRTGDDGNTRLVGGVRVKKTDIRIEAYGTVDELNSHLGLLASYMHDGHDKSVIQHIQKMLFNICTYLATDQEQTPLPASADIPEDETDIFETEIDAIQQEITDQAGFILPGGCRAAATAHICRTVCRRAERRILELAETAKVEIKISSYINRLSDYLFVLAKKLNFIEGVREKIWDNSCE